MRIDRTYPSFRQSKACTMRPPSSGNMGTSTLNSSSSRLIQLVRYSPKSIQEPSSASSYRPTPTPNGLGIATPHHLPLSSHSSGMSTTASATFTAGPPTTVIRCARQVFGGIVNARPPSGHMSTSFASPPVQRHARQCPNSCRRTITNSAVRMIAVAATPKPPALHIPRSSSATMKMTKIRCTRTAMPMMRPIGTAQVIGLSNEGRSPCQSPPGRPKRRIGLSSEA